MRGWMTVGLAALALGGCEAGERAEPSASETPRADAASIVPAQTASDRPAPEPPASPAGLKLPDTFTALGTEPFWAAKVAGGRLTYMTPEDQAGQTIAVEREDGAELVELSGTLAGKPLALTITKGPCSDGMSDVVYRWSVVRRLGDDVQRGCARLPNDVTEGGKKP